MSVSTLQQTPVHSEKDVSYFQQLYITTNNANMPQHASIASITSLERNAIQYANDYDRFQSPKLNQQRALVTDSKQQEFATLSVVAKLERAIGRRYSMQDAEFTKKVRAPVIAQKPVTAAAKA
ncbi:hypothetical protein BCR37DRAFT_75670 [Protomyces lactucae-debilis]|uniref:Uncharacterized protein n=1 Tax=Protomyces lactucae-debilis TaxID=2754530 RepID=A0A1Y2F7M3_PROLT|nr:uncharacterized protein BCR37DRAFT_75670 [Protomyces lactucae-debilis]ORY79859.1 hypothetical protein BCR37DRAFT_75670 [Protomyces lactucae-debilis]